MEDSNTKKKKLKLVKLSKDSQKQILGGAVRGKYCTAGETCFGSFSRVVIGSYKNG